ncbi:MAG: LVIVD repeat-containing protein [Candidatus Hodarchaeota archaeon]
MNAPRIISFRQSLSILIIVLSITSLSIFYHVQANDSQYTLIELSTIPAQSNSQIVDVQVSDNILFVLDAFHGLTAYDISNPTQPAQLGHFSDMNTFVHSILIVDKYAYLSDYDDGLEIIDISDPMNLKIIGWYKPGISASSIDAYLSNDLVFLASQSRGLEIINCSNPSKPICIGTYYEGHRVIRTYSVKNLVFISEALNGFKILNITNGVCNEIYHFIDSVSYQCFHVQNDLLYTTDKEFGVHVFDISDLSNIVKIGEYNTGRTYGFYLEKKDQKMLLYVTTWEKGLAIFDISDPKNIDFLIQYNDGDGGEVYNVAVQDELVFVAEFKAGLEILKFLSFEDALSKTSSKTTFISSFELILIVIFTLFFRHRLNDKN